MESILNNIVAQLPVVAVFLIWAYVIDKARAVERQKNDEARKEEREVWSAERKAEREAWVIERQADIAARERMEQRFETTLVEERKSRELQAQLFVKSLDSIDGKMNTYQEEFRKAVAIMMERTAHDSTSRTRPRKDS